MNPLTILICVHSDRTREIRELKINYHYIILCNALYNILTCQTLIQAQRYSMMK